jgi:hypothetical protein
MKKARSTRLQIDVLMAIAGELIFVSQAEKMGK